MGAKAARRAAQDALTSGLTITGTIDSYEQGQAASSLAELHPSGVVTLVREDSAISIERDAPTARRGHGKVSD
jgi:hypothetical protein